MGRYRLVDINARNVCAARSARPGVDLDRVNLLVEFLQQVASILKIMDERARIRRENVTSVGAAEREYLLNLAARLCVLIDHRAGDAASLALDGGELFDCGGFSQIVQILCVLDSLLVKNVHSSAPFLFCWFYCAG